MISTVANSDLNWIRTLANSELILANSGLIFIWTLVNSDLVFMRSELASGQGTNCPRSKSTIAEVRIDQGPNCQTFFPKMSGNNGIYWEIP